MTQVCHDLLKFLSNEQPKQGLLNEIEEMRALENEFRVGGEQDYTRGIFQAIGQCDSSDVIYL